MGDIETQSDTHTHKPKGKPKIAKSELWPSVKEQEPTPRENRITHDYKQVGRRGDIETQSDTQ